MEPAAVRGEIHLKGGSYEKRTLMSFSNRSGSNGAAILRVVRARQCESDQLVFRRAASGNLKGWTESILRFESSGWVWRIGPMGVAARQHRFAMGGAGQPRL